MVWWSTTAVCCIVSVHCQIDHIAREQATQRRLSSCVPICQNILVLLCCYTVLCVLHHRRSRDVNSRVTLMIQTPQYRGALLNGTTQSRFKFTREHTSPRQHISSNTCHPYCVQLENSSDYSEGKGMVRVSSVLILHKFNARLC